MRGAQVRFLNGTGILFVGPNSPVQLRQLPQPSRYFLSQRLRLESPGPIAFSAIGKIHPRFISQPQQVLQRNDGGIRNRCQDHSNKVPVDFSALSIQVPYTKASLCLDLFC